MSKYATKAAGNMFCQARYEAAKFNERLGSREGNADAGYEFCKQYVRNASD